MVLTVDVARVGSYAMLPNSTMTPRSLIPLEGDVSENEELMKMSGLMIYVSLDRSYVFVVKPLCVSQAFWRFHLAQTAATAAFIDEYFCMHCE